MCDGVDVLFCLSSYNPMEFSPQSHFKALPNQGGLFVGGNQQVTLAGGKAGKQTSMALGKLNKYFAITNLYDVS